jgi:diguanylate cyclase (GGDEF)-like protein/PAS domain S-box-containing protein
VSEVVKKAEITPLSDGNTAVGSSRTRRDRIVSEQVKLVYTHAFSGLLVTLAGALLLVVVLWPAAGHARLALWLGVMVAVLAGCYALVRSYRRATDIEAQASRWRVRLVTGAAALGFGWGLAGVALFPADGVYQLFLALLLAGLVAGALPYLAAVPRAYLALVSPSLLPFAVLLLVKGGRTYSMMAVLVLVFAAVMWITARAVNTAILRSLHLRLQNLDLIRDLSQAKAEVERANAGLQNEIEERERDEARLYREKELAQITLESIGDGVITTGIAGKVDYLNPVAEQLTGWTNVEARGLPLSKVLVLMDETTGLAAVDPVKRCLEEGRSFRLSDHTVLIHRAEDRDFAVQVAISPVHDRERQCVGTVMVFHDVTEIRGIARRMSYQASHDSLTGLVNRQEFERRLRRLLENARSEARCHAMCYLDLDQFKIVNDTCGHIAGDELLRQLATALQNGVRENDTLGRLGGDEFGVLLEGCPLDRAISIAEGLRQIVQEFRFAWQDHVFEIGVCIGLVPINADSGSLTEVLSSADAACYLAKSGGRGRVHVYEPDATTVAQRHGEMQWVSRIGAALEEGRAQLYAQPTLPLSNKARRREYSEILLRIYNEEGTLVPNAAFFPAAKRYNMMPTIDRWVIRKFCSLISEAQIPVHQGLGIFAINLSGQSLSDESFLDFVVDQLRQSQVQPNNICFEITETAAIANLTRAMRFISVLKTMGAHFALDDFGSGLSSFAYLKNLQVDFLKIDGSFIKDTKEDPVDYAMVKIINQIGNVMDIRTIAEAVERQSVLAKLKELGVDYAQGFAIAEPASLQESLADMLRQRA